MEVITQNPMNRTRMQMELNYIHMAVRLATCNILKLNYSSWSRDWIQMIAVNEVGAPD